MQISVKFLFTILATAAVSFTTPALITAQQPDLAKQAGPAPGTNDRYGPRRGGRGFGGFMGGGILGTVTEVAAEHYTVKTDQGETYTIHYSANTRIMKQPAGGGRRQSAQGATPQEGGAQGTARGNNPSDYDRQPPQPLRPTDIKVGDVITSGGEVDATAKSVGAVFILQVDPERAKQMREMQANFGKTWLGGRITAIDGTKITIEGALDHTPHAIEVDENTSFRKRRDSITLADLQPGDQLRADGAVKNGVFLATTVNSMGRPNPGGPATQAPTQPN